VFTSHPIRRPAIVTALAVALLGVTLSGPAAAQPTDIHDGWETSSPADTTSTPRQDLRTPDAIDAARRIKIALAMERYYQGEPGPLVTEAPAQAPSDDDAALALEQYYQSFGEPAPLVADTPAPAPVEDDAPLLPIAIAVAAALAVVAASATHVRRLRLRRRRTAGALS
jgi:hypothetical protein